MAEFTKEQLIEHAQAESAALKAMIEYGGYSADVVDFLKRKMQLDEIALAALTADIDSVTEDIVEYLVDCGEADDETIERSTEYVKNHLSALAGRS